MDRPSTKTLNLIRRICKEYPEDVARVLLESPFQFEGLEPRTTYARQSDDTRSQLGVIIGPDGDSWVEVISNLNPDEFTFMHRFRNEFIGGGQSPHIFIALRILALAIKLDCEHRTQRPLPFHIPAWEPKKENKTTHKKCLKKRKK